MTTREPTGGASAAPTRRAWRGTAVVLRLLLAAALVRLVLPALVAPELPLALRAGALVVLLVSCWRPTLGLTAVAGLTPAGLLYAGVPAHAAELLALAFLCGWVGGVWRPLGMARASGVVRLAAGVYGACLIASWMGQTLTAASGVAPAALAGFLLRELPSDYALFSSPDPETWAFLNAIIGVGVFLAALALSRTERRLAGWVAAAVAAAMAGLGVLTVAHVLREWAGAGYGGWFLFRYTQGVRASAHLTDLNAAGSQYVLGGLAAAAVAVAVRGWRRAPWAVAAVMMLPAFWLSGSRSAAVGGIVVGAVLVALARRSRGQSAAGAHVVGVGGATSSWRPSGPIAVGAVAVLVLALAAAVTTGGLSTDERGSAGHALRLRSMFLETSGRMLASAPVYGVGVGQYLPRSAEFMPPALHAIYPLENAHNYFAQMFAELGVVGGLAFLALVSAGLGAAWRGARARDASPAATGVCAATAGYLLTCLTGHPLLVPEAALPFWALFGVAAGCAAHEASPSRRAWTVAVAACLLLTGSVASHAVDVTRVPAVPLERGFHDQHVSPDGVTYRWSTRHAIAWIPPAVGYLTIPLRSPDLPRRGRAFSVQVEVDGRVVKTAAPVPERWTSVGVSIRTPARREWRRVDIRVNQVWTPKRDQGDATDDRPMGVMVGAISLETLPVAASPVLPSR